MIKTNVFFNFTFRCIGADVVSKLGVSSEALAAVSADAIGRSDQSSGGGGTSLFGYVFIVHVGGTRCVTWSIDRIVQRHACITWGVELILAMFFIFFLYV